MFQALSQTVSFSLKVPVLLFILSDAWSPVLDLFLLENLSISSIVLCSSLLTLNKLGPGIPNANIPLRKFT